MKSLMKIDDRMSVYKIEAARFSFIMMEKSYQNLISTLRIIENESTPNESVVEAIMQVWQFVDMAFRFFRVFSEIRGIKHKDQRVVNCKKANAKLTQARNFIQHLNTMIPKVTEEIYPILGAISWASKNLNYSFVITLGTHPKGTSFHSLPYEKSKHKFMDDIALNVDTISVSIKEVYQAMQTANIYLSEFLVAENYLSNDELIPFKAKINSLNFGAVGTNFTRVKFS